MSHFEAMFVFAILVSTVFALITKNTPKEQFQYGVRVFLAFLGVAVTVSWLMYPFPM